MMRAQHGVARISSIIAVLLFSLTVAQSAVAPGAGEDGTKPKPKAAAPHYGLPIDWSSRYTVMTGGDPEAALASGVKEPRVVYNLVRRMVAIRNASSQAKVVVPKRIKVDWSVSLETGFVPQNQYPAKYQFNVTAEDCNKDYAVFALTTTSTTQGNLVGINNLYTSKTPTPCNSGSPWVAFSYDATNHTNGQLRTSPTISEDGTKVAFVESATGPTRSYFHVLVLPNPIPVPPAQSGTVITPLTPTACTNGKPTTPGCMTTLTIGNATNTLSSVWVDYNSDTAYVGLDNGILYKISPVFGGGAPALSTDATNWPVTVVTSGSSKVLTDPIVDVFSGRIFLGDGNGYLYAVNLAAPGKATAARLPIGWTDQGAGTAIVDPPIVVNDTSNPTINQVFAFTGCSNVLGVGGAITQLPANFTSSTTVSTANTVDLGSGTGIGDCTGSNAHAGDFDNAFWLSGTNSGHMITCGFVNAGGVPSDPQMYEFPFNIATHVITSPATTTWVINSTAGDECSPLTEFFDGTTDRIFFGIGSTSDGFIESSSITAGLPAPTCGASPTSTCVKAPSALGGTSGIIVDNQLFGTSGGANIYFSTLAPGSVNGGNCHVTGGTATPYCAVKLTQSALQ